MSEDDLRRFNDETCNACSATVVTYEPTEPFSSQWDRPQYAMPSWWSAEPSLPERMGDAAFSAGVEYPPSKVAPPSTSSMATERSGAERMTAKAAHPGDRDLSGTARETEDSPFFDGRAQPGDVIGLDTGGETTDVGDTSEDENKRRRAAEEAAKKARS
jgi:hypothetical protein